MINKWHKAILIKEIDYENIPSKIISKIRGLNNSMEVLEYEELFVELGYDFDSVIDELEQIDEEDRKNYIYQLLVDQLPKKQELKHIEKAMAKFDLWNYLASTLNEGHDVEEFSKKLDDEYLEETLQNWKREKISRLASKREALIKEREERRAALLKRRKDEKITKDEEAELDYIEKDDEELGIHFEEVSFEMMEDSTFEFDDSSLEIPDTIQGMSEIDINGDFSEFNAEQLNAQINVEAPMEIQQERTEVLEDGRTNTQEPTVEGKAKIPKKSKKEKQKPEKVEVEVYKTDPKLIKKVEDAEHELQKVISNSQEEINRAREEVSKLMEERQREVAEINETYRKLSKEERRLFEEEKNKHREDVEERQKKIDWLNNYILEKEQAEKDLQELEANLEKASIYDELKGMSKKELRELCDKLTIIYSKKLPKADLIQKLMKKSENLRRVYNMIDLEEEVMRRLELARKTTSKTSELVIDPFSDVDLSSNTAVDMFGDDDPFSSIDLSAGLDDMFGGGTDPFANIDTSGSMDDAFGGGNDPFANVDTSGSMDDEFSSGADPFANVSGGGVMDDEFSSGADPFANISKSGYDMSSDLSGGNPFDSLNNNKEQVENETAETPAKKKKKGFFK